MKKFLSKKNLMIGLVAALLVLLSITATYQFYKPFDGTFDGTVEVETEVDFNVDEIKVGDECPHEVIGDLKVE